MLHVTQAQLRTLPGHHDVLDLQTAWLPAELCVRTQQGNKLVKLLFCVHRATSHHHHQLRMKLLLHVVAEVARNDVENYVVGSTWQLRAHIVRATTAVLAAFARYHVSAANAITAAAAVNGYGGDNHEPSSGVGMQLDVEGAEVALVARERALVGLRDVSLRVRLASAGHLDTLLGCAPARCLWRWARPHVLSGLSCIQEPHECESLPAQRPSVHQHCPHAGT